LWERIPGVTQQDVEAWKAQAATADPLGQLTQLLDAQAAAEIGDGDNP
jgi:hypothetical protein